MNDNNTKGAGGKWKPGQSGNPNGRPSNTESLTALRAQLADLLPDAIDKLREQVRAGDVAACRVVVERCIPPLKPVELPAQVDMTGCDNHAERVQAVVDAAIRGDVTSAKATELLASLEAGEQALKVAKRRPSFLERR